MSTLFDAFLNQVRSRPESVALIGEVSDDGSIAGSPTVRSLRWIELADWVSATMRRLDEAFSRQPDLPWRIGHASSNRLADVVIAIAATGLGAIEFPFDHREGTSTEGLWRPVGGRWLDEDWKSELESGQLRSSCSSDDRSRDRWRLKQLLSDPPRHNPNDPALVLWTSGTTEQPRGVTLSHRNLLGNAAAKLKAVPQSAADLRLTTLPLCHAYARTCDLGTWLLSGCTLAVTLGYEGWQKMGAAVRPSLANSVPSLAGRLAEGDAAELGLDRLRLLGCGGAAMSTDAFELWRARGVVVIQGYGLTEASPVVCSATPSDVRPGLVGRPVDGWETQLRDGRLHLRGPHTMLGYWDAPDATAAKLDSAGWLDTGDLVEIDDASGQYRILGRADDTLVLPSGRKFHPTAFERAIGSLPGIRHAMLVLNDTRLEGWLDLEPGIEWQAGPRIDLEVGIERSLVDALSHFPSWQRPRVFFKLDPPLSVSRGELTVKGTIRRDQVLRQRLQQQPRGAGVVIMG